VPQILLPSLLVAAACLLFFTRLEFSWLVRMI